MTLSIQRAVVLVFCILCFNIPTTFGQEVESYVFPGGAQISYPADWELDIRSNSDVVFLSNDRLLLGFYEPALLQDTIENQPVTILERLFQAFYHEYGLSFDANQISEIQLRNRTITRYDFTDPIGSSAILLAVPFRDGRYGVVEVLVSTEDASTQLDLADVATIVQSFNNSVLANRYTFPSDVAFSYPENWQIDDTSISGVALTQAETVSLAFLEPQYINSPEHADIPDSLQRIFLSIYPEIVYYPELVQPFPFNARDIRVYTYEFGEQAATMIALRFSNDRVGIIDIHGSNILEPRANERSNILQMIESFDAPPNQE